MKLVDVVLSTYALACELGDGHETTIPNELHLPGNVMCLSCEIFECSRLIGVGPYVQTGPRSFK
jgi:hypothetical protein